MFISKRVKYIISENTVVRQPFKSCTSMECPNQARLFWLLTFFVLDHKKTVFDSVVESLLISL